MINLLAIIPNLNNATSLYRAMGPLSDLRRSMDLNVIIADKVTTVTLDMMDYVFMQRPATQDALRLAKVCKQNGTPLWIDYDDLLIDIPEDNPAFDAYMGHEVKSAIIGLIGLADVVTVSTPELKRQISKCNKRVYVVPNALHEKFLPLARGYRPRPLINWRGSPTHQKDLDCYKKPILELALEREHLMFNFIGYNPWWITERMRKNQVMLAPWMDFESYFQHNAAINAPIQIVPLNDSTFNRCKSNIAWIEATLAGGVCVAPSWEEWMKPGCVNYTCEEEFYNHVKMLLDHPELAESHWEESRNYIIKNLMLNNVNETRKQIMEGLLAQSRGFKDQYPAGGE